jgi:SAM-dependent methyltransferase
MNTNKINELRKEWEAEEKIAHIHGWDFSHIHGRYEEEDDLPWDYEAIIKSYLTDNMQLMDFDTGGGEFLLSLKHPYENTAATEGYPPNVELCKETLLPLGIDFRACDDAKNVPFEDESFDMLINRHGDFNPRELHRVLIPGGLFITQQVGEKNDRDLVEMVLPGVENPFPGLNKETQVKELVNAGFEILQSDEVFKPIRFYDVGAFVWFARVIVWEFPDFSVDRCFDKLLELQRIIEEKGFIEGTIHRYMIVARNVSSVIA